MNEREPLEALLALVEADRAARLRAIEAESGETARTLLATARRSASDRVRSALAPERRRLRERLAALDARLATETRLAAQRRLRARLDEAWRVLPAALEARWREPSTRRLWVDRVREAAARALGAGPWRVIHAPGWTPAEREAFAIAARDAGAGPVDFEESALVAAGLVVRAGSGVVDGTARGLLADRDAIDARLADALGFGEAGP